MANPFEGETFIEAGGKTYTLCFNARTIAMLEREFGRLEGKPLVGTERVMSYLTSADQIGITVMSLWLWAGLRRHHKEVTQAEAEDLVLLAGGAPKLFPIFVEALRLAFPEPEGDERPPGPDQGGTGPAYSSTTAH